MAAGVHHSAICTTNVDAALRFWRDGMGLVEQFDMTFAGAWRDLFGARSDELRSIFLGDPAQPDTGLVELVVFAGTEPALPLSSPPAAGLFLLSFERDVDETVARLESLGVARNLRRIEQPVGDGRYVPMAVVSAPDEVRVELIGLPR